MTFWSGTRPRPPSPRNPRATAWRRRHPRSPSARRRSGGTRPTPARPRPGSAGRTDDHLAAHLLAQDAVGGADVVLALGRHGRRLDAVAGLAHRARRLQHHVVAGLAPPLQREVEALLLHLDPQHLRVEHPQRLLQQLLAGLVALQHDDPHQATAPRPSRPESLCVLVERGDHEGHVLVEVHPQLRSALAHRLAVDRGREGGRLHLLLDRLGCHPVDALGPHVRARHHEAATARRPRTASSPSPTRAGPRGSRHGRPRRARTRARSPAAQRLLQRHAGMARLEVRMPLVVEVVQHPDEAPDTPRLRRHDGRTRASRPPPPARAGAATPTPSRSRTGPRPVPAKEAQTWLLP